MESCKRTTIKLKRPNPLFEKWLLDWQTETAEINQNKKVVFQKALESLRKYPIELKSGKECMILENFDTDLCVKLDRKLVEHRRSEAERFTKCIDSTVCPSTFEHAKLPIKKKKKQETNISQEVPIDNEIVKPRRKYVPNYRSAAYALLITIFKKENLPDYMGFMSKVELQIEAQSFSNSSFKRVLPGTHYTAWSSMSQLISKGLIRKTGNPARYSLTSSGRELCEEMIRNVKVSSISGQESSALKTPAEVDMKEKQLEIPNKIIQVSQINLKKTTQDIEKGSETALPTVFIPGSFDICLLIDTAESSGGLRKGYDKIEAELRNTGIQFEVRHLKVGDFAWVCRNKESREELMLPYIVERKRLDDLSKSIRDGRFHEQKFRLKQCGIPNLIYLVEGSEQLNYGMPATSLLQAIMNTQVVDGFTVKVTSGYRSAMRYLAVLTTLFTNTFKSKTLMLCKKDNAPLAFNIQDNPISLFTFNEFSQDTGKIRNFSVKEMFVKQLVQLHGVSADKAWAVVQRYPTPGILLKAYEEKQQLLSDLEYGPLSRKLGPAISNTLFNFYTKHSFIT